MGSHRHQDEPSGFASKLRRLRDAAGISQHDLATRAGMNIGGITKLEQGHREPSWATVVALAAALGVTPNEFLPATAEPEFVGSRPSKLK